MKKKPAQKDQHKKRAFALRLDERVRAQLATLASRNATKITEEINTAIREKLQRENLWPPA